MAILSSRFRVWVLRFLFVSGLLVGSVFSGMAAETASKVQPTKAQVQPWSTLAQILSEKKLTWSSSAYLVLTANGTMASNNTPEYCFAILQRLGWVAQTTPARLAKDKISLADFCFLLTQAFRWEGGWWYSWFPGSGTAFRELLWAGYLPQSADPDDTITGAQAANLLRQVFVYQHQRGVL
ncbi:MAG: hypothetical protein HKM05_01720 [Spirochaetales bacterium]|nr:hypothetical protein [Spirochaetales bacterium]